MAVALAAALATRSRGGHAPGEAGLLQAVANDSPTVTSGREMRVAGADGLPEHTSVRHAAEVLGSGYRMSGPTTVPIRPVVRGGASDDCTKGCGDGRRARRHRHHLRYRGWGDRRPHGRRCPSPRLARGLRTAAPDRDE
ncbi:hypothetical protein GCM10017687_34540 [Streptomyces echinatus]